ncbi:MAG: hypothetical protein AB7S38_12165 [Vulcanimicrobiota bacterium]
MELAPAEIDIVGLDEAVLMRGYLYLVVPGPDALTELETDDDEEPWPVSFDPECCPPSSGDCVAELEKGYLVISEVETAEELTRLDGWEVAPANLEENYELQAPPLYVRILRRRKDGQVLVVACG